MASRGVYLLALGVGLAVVLPLLVVVYPPLHDYPFHLARADALAALAGQVGHGTPYEAGSFALANVAMDVVTLGLTAVMAPVVAGRVFLGLTLLVMLGGVVALHRVLHGRVSPWPWMAGFFLYNWIFLFGFTNYLFGVGMMLWSVAAWLALARGWVGWRLAAGCVAAVVLLFCHLSAFGVFAVVVGGLALGEVGERWREARRLDVGPLVVAAVPVVVAVGVFAAISPTAGDAGAPLAYHPWIGWKPLVAYRGVLGSIPWLDAVTIGPVVVVVAGLALGRRVGLAREMVVPLGLMAASFVVMPYGLFGSLYGDARLPIAILLLAIAATDVRAGAVRGLGVAVVAVLVGLLWVRGGVIAAQWRRTEPVIGGMVAAFAGLPAGSILYAATAEPYPSLAYRDAAELARWDPPLKHVASLASVGRAVFVPSTWADPAKQPIAVPSALMAAKRAQGDNPFQTRDGVALAGAVEVIRGARAAGTDGAAYLLLLHPTLLAGAVPPGLRAVGDGEGFALFAVE